jgi:hypothetical protein
MPKFPTGKPTNKSESNTEKPTSCEAHKITIIRELGNKTLTGKGNILISTYAVLTMCFTSP